MTPAFKQKWVAALRSGKYKQGKAYLRSESDEYCCLGVALDVLGVEWKKESAPSILFGKTCYSAEGCIGILSPSFHADIFGVSYGHSSKFIVMNDELNKTFYEIADYIEENY